MNLNRSSIIFFVSFRIKRCFLSFVSLSYLCLFNKGVEGVRSQPLSEFWGIQRWDTSGRSRGSCGCNCLFGCLLANGTLHLEKKEQTTVSTHDGHGDWRKEIMRVFVCVYRRDNDGNRLSKRGSKILLFQKVTNNNTRIPNSIFMCARKSRRKNRQLSTLVYESNDVRWWSPGKTPRTTLSMPSHSGGGEPIDRFWPWLVACLVAITAMRRRAVAAATEKTMVALFGTVDLVVNVVVFFLSCRFSWLAKALKKNPNRKTRVFSLSCGTNKRASICANACAPSRGLFQYYWGLRT